MVFAYSASQTMSSSSTPSASATIATASPNTAVPSAVIAVEVGVVDRPAEAGRLLGVGRVVEGGVGRLADRDLVDPIADAGEHDAEQLGEPGLMPGAEERRAAALARVDESLAIGAEAAGR